MTEQVQKIRTPKGETLVVLPLVEYESLLDAADVVSATRLMSNIAAGVDELVPEVVVDRLLAGENAIRVWREFRGLSAAALAVQSGVSSGYLSELEGGKKVGSVLALKRIAAALTLTIDDLVAA